MTIKFKKTRAIVAGSAIVDEAEDLFRWLDERPKASVDLGEVEVMHTAILQAVAAADRPITALPADPFLAECLRQMARIADRHAHD